MNSLKAEVERFAAGRSESDLRIVAGEILKLCGKNGTSQAIPIRDADDQDLGIFLSGQTIEKPDLSDYNTFIAVSKYRREYPPEKHLTPEEFIALLERE